MYTMFLNLGFKRLPHDCGKEAPGGRRLKVGNAGENVEGEATEVLFENAIMKSNTLYANSKKQKQKKNT